ncbi:MAG: hypothetical protein BGN88_09870 [Clostridiales bacterium 43-6]|nr:MAG: hypothetical protein BGN88_09870 [Clostridiales bacterium 43-6]
MNISQKVINQIQKVLEKNQMKGTIEEETKLFQAFTIDSLIAIEILVSMEEIFNIVIEDDDLSLELLETPKTLINYIDNKLN